MAIIHQKKYSNQALAWFILLLLSLIWGSSFILIKKSLLAFSGIQVGLARISISFLAFLPLIIYNLRRIDTSRIFLFILIGLTGNGLPAILYAIAETKVDSAIAGVLNSLTPIFTLILAWLVWKTKTSRAQWFGILMSFAGTIWLLLVSQQGFSFANLPYGSLIILATFCYGLNVNLVQHKLKDLSPIMISLVSFLFIGPPALFYLVFGTDFINQITAHDQGLVSFVAVCILALIGTVISSIIFYRLVKLTDAVFASLVSFLIPIVALLWGYLDGEQLVLLHVVGMVAILIGIYLVKKKGPIKIR